MEMNQKSILIVEDEAIVSMDLEKRLTSMGFTVLDKVTCGEEAISKANRFLPDLILMDIHLKGEMDGITAAEKIKDNQDIPIIYLTAFADTETLERAKITEPFGYLIKPFKERELFSTLEMALYKANTERKIKENEELLTRIFQSISDGIVITDEKNRITSVNSGALKLSGYKREELLGVDLGSLYFELRNENETPSPGNRYFLKQKSGTSIPAEISEAPLKGKKGDTAGSVLVFRDISERVHYEEELVRAREEALAASKAKSDFLATMSHELRTPLNSIIGLTELLLEKKKPEDEESEDLSIIYNSGKNLLFIINSILDYQKLESGNLVLEKRIFSLKKMMQEVVKEFHPWADRKGLSLSLTTSFGSDLWVSSDSRKISQIIRNLIHNSIKFTVQGSVKVEGRLEEEKEINLLHIIVKDTGIGIPKEKLEIIFQAFVQVDNTYTRHFEGSGLGLTIVKQLTELMGGKVWVLSGGKGGSEFHIRIPLEYVKHGSSPKGEGSMGTGEDSLEVRSQIKFLNLKEPEGLKALSEFYVSFKDLLNKEEYETIITKAKNLRNSLKKEGSKELSDLLLKIILSCRNKTRGKLEYCQELLEDLIKE